MKKLSSEQYEFIEEFGLLGMKLGMPRATARVVALLLICEPAEQSAADIRQALDLSLGSVSTALSMLLTVGMVDRVAKTGERTLYYSITAGGILRSVEQRIASFEEIAALAAKGQVVAPNNPRINTLHNVYATLVHDFDDILAKLKQGS